MKITKTVSSLVFLGALLSSCLNLSGAENVWALSDAYQEKTETRQKVCLNGVWKINFEDGKGLFKQKKLTAKQRILQNLKKTKKEIIPQKKYQTAKAWEDIRVPGPWYDTAWYSYTKNESLLKDKLAEKPRERVSNKIKRRGKSLKDYPFSWYQRKVTIPKNWTAGKFYLRFEHFSLTGWAFVNNQYIGRQNGALAHNMAMPENVKAGQTVSVDVLISAQVGGYEKVFMGGEQIATRKKTAPLRGITGDVWLIYKKADQIQDVLIQPSVRKKHLDIQIDMTPGFKGSFSGSIADAGSTKPVKIFDAKTAKLAKKSSGKYLLSIPWENPVLWNPDHPYLYTLKLKAVNTKGKTLDEYYPITFGFRELWIKGRQYYFNGNPCHFRLKQLSGHPENVSAAMIDQWKKVGYNAIETSARLGDVDDILRVADKKGMMVFLGLPGVNNIVSDWHNEQTRDKWQKKMKAIFDRGKNHASVVHWVSNVNLLSYPFDLHFDKLGTDYLPKPTSNPGVKWKVAKDSEKIITQMDSSRPMLHHAGGNFGQVHNSNMYLNFLPLQEKEEWLSVWAEKGKKPYIAIELGMPYEASYYANRLGVTHHSCFSCEPLNAEYTARVLGPAAYKMADQSRLQAFIDSPVEIGVLDGVDKYANFANYYYGNIRRKPLKDYIASQVILGDFIKNWRTYPASGFNTFSTEYDLWENWRPTSGKKKEYKSLKTPGTKPVFDYQPAFSKETPLLAAYKKWLKPELYYLSGPANNFTDKRHAYYVGEKVNKAVAMINDSFTDKKADLNVDVKELTSGKSVFSKDISKKMTPGQHAFAEISFTAPAVNKKTNYEIILSENSKKIDSFNIQVFPKRSQTTKLNRNLMLLDQAGNTEKVLKQKGINFKKYQGQKLGEKDLLLIATGSLDALKKSAEVIKASVAEGLNIFIMPQKKEDLESVFALRSVISRGRRVFKADTENSMLAGLEQEDLSYWNGAPAFKDSTRQSDGDVYPTILWEKSKNHVVANTVIEKPHQGAFKTWLHEGFDLLYAALLEEKIGKGKIMFCQLNLFSRNQENPASDIIFDNIINYLDKTKVNRVLPVYYSGGEHGAEILNAIGVAYSPLGKNSAMKSPGILVVSDFKQVSAAKLAILKNLNIKSKTSDSSVKLDGTKIKSFLDAGGKVVVLATQDLDKFNKMLGIQSKGHKTERFAFHNKSLDGMFDCLTDADWYWKERSSVPLPAQDFPVDVISKGKGKIVVCQIDPFSFSSSEMPEKQRRVRYKKLRNISLVMQALGASFNKSTIDYVIAQKEHGPIDLSGEWKFRIDMDDKGLEKSWQKNVWKDSWKKIKVPGTWESQGYNTPNPKVNGKLPYDGFAWYQLTVKIPKSYKGKTLFFDAKVIDDFDWTYFNGELIGKIAEETPKYWETRRLYPIPEKLINYGGENTITVRVFDKLYGGGILKAPVQLSVPRKKVFPYLDSDLDETARFNPYKFQRW